MNDHNGNNTWNDGREQSPGTDPDSSNRNQRYDQPTGQAEGAHAWTPDAEQSAWEAGEGSVRSHVNPAITNSQTHSGDQVDGLGSDFQSDPDYSGTGSGHGSPATGQSPVHGQDCGQDRSQDLGPANAMDGGWERGSLSTPGLYEDSSPNYEHQFWTGPEQANPPAELHTWQPDEVAFGLVDENGFPISVQASAEIPLDPPNDQQGGNPIADPGDHQYEDRGTIDQGWDPAPGSGADMYANNPGPPNFDDGQFHLQPLHSHPSDLGPGGNISSGSSEVGDAKDQAQDPRPEFDTDPGPRDTATWTATSCNPGFPNVQDRHDSQADQASNGNLPGPGTGDDSTQPTFEQPSIESDGNGGSIDGPADHNHELRDATTGDFEPPSATNPIPSEHPSTEELPHMANPGTSSPRPFEYSQGRGLDTQDQAYPELAPGQEVESQHADLGHQSHGAVAHADTTGDYQDRSSGFASTFDSADRNDDQLRVSEESFAEVRTQGPDSDPIDDQTPSQDTAIEPPHPDDLSSGDSVGEDHTDPAGYLEPEALVEPHLLGALDQIPLEFFGDHDMTDMVGAPEMGSYELTPVSPASGDTVVVTAEGDQLIEGGPHRLDDEHQAGGNAAFEGDGQDEGRVGDQADDQEGDPERDDQSSSRPIREQDVGLRPSSMDSAGVEVGTGLAITSGSRSRPGLELLNRMNAANGDSGGQRPNRGNSLARSAQTEDAYAARVRQLYAHSLAQRMTDPQQPPVISPLDVVADFVDNASSRAASSWKTYRAALLWHLAQNRQSASAFEEGYQILAATCKASGVPRSGSTQDWGGVEEGDDDGQSAGSALGGQDEKRTKKTISREDLATLIRTLSTMDGRAHWGSKTSHWLLAGLASGARIGEWEGACWQDASKTILSLPNAKRKKTQPVFRITAPGETIHDVEANHPERLTPGGVYDEATRFRHVPIDHTESLWVDLHLKSIAQYIASRPGDPNAFKFYYSYCRKIVHEASKRAFKGKKMFSLYVMRSQFSANKKAQLTLEEVADLMGHTETRTTMSSYGPMSAAHTKRVLTDAEIQAKAQRQAPAHKPGTEQPV